MGKIRVEDLARMMGLGTQDLIFKLRSIGVRVEGEDALVDSEVLQAVLQGKKLATPREVIVRDEQAKETAPPRPSRRLAGRRPGPLRPSRPRTMIHRVETRIETIPVREKPAAAAETKTEPAAEEAAAPPAEAAAPVAELQEAPVEVPKATEKAPEPVAEPKVDEAERIAAKTEKRRKRRAERDDKMFDY